MEMKRLIAIVVGCAVMASASAQDRVVVDYSKMDLTTPAGADALYLRILNVAEAVCPQPSFFGLSGQLVWRKCMQDAVGQAVQDVHNPLVTARYHGAMSGKLYSSRATTK
jgi:UrcA family protein